MAAEIPVGATRLVTPKMPPRLPSKDDPAGFPEDVALFTVAMAKERALELLDGLGEPARQRARARAREAMRWDSPTRQAKVAVLFGARKDANERLRALMAEAPQPLQQEIYRLLPPYYRSLFPDFTPGPTERPVPPYLAALANRLVREAIRY